MFKHQPAVWAAVLMAHLSSGCLVRVVEPVEAEPPHGGYTYPAPAPSGYPPPPRRVQPVVVHQAPAPRHPQTQRVVRAKEIRAGRIVAGVIYAKEVKANAGEVGYIHESRGDETWERGRSDDEISVPEIHADVIYAKEIKADWISAREIHAKKIRIRR